MKRILCVIVLAMLMWSACAELNVVCSIFPQYDFTRRIAGEHAHVTQLLPEGMDSHEYEPSPREILACDRADLLIYTDDELEKWVANLKDSLTNVTLVRCADGIDLEALNEEWEEHEQEAEHEHEHEHAYDAHIWLDPTLAIVMCENIRDALIAKDPDNAADYTANAEALIADLTALDAKFTELFANNEGITLYFGGKFAYSHFLRHYGIKYVSAYSDCSDEGEPGARVIVQMVRQMRENNVQVIFVDELSSGEVANAIADETGCEVLLFHTCHNLSKDDSGLTYIDIMNMNYENIEKALNK